MDFINNMRGKLSLASQNTVQKAKDISEIAKLNSTISSLEKQLNELYEKIGYEIYNAYKDTPIPEVSTQLIQAADIHQLIETCREQIKTINSNELCPQCKAKINKDMLFCSECGYKLVHEEVAEGTVANESSAEKLVCSNCGEILANTAVFCSCCGQRVEVSVQEQEQK